MVGNFTIILALMSEVLRNSAMHVRIHHQRGPP